MSLFKDKMRKLGNSIDRGLDWCCENPVKAGIIVGIGSKIIWEVGRASKRRQIDRIETEKKMSVYDPGIDSRWQLKRIMTNNEMLEFQSRLDAGQARGDALREMGLLRR